MTYLQDTFLLQHCHQRGNTITLLKNKIKQYQMQGDKYLIIITMCISDITIVSHFFIKEPMHSISTDKLSKNTIKNLIHKNVWTSTFMLENRHQNSLGHGGWGGYEIKNIYGGKDWYWDRDVYRSGKIFVRVVFYFVTTVTNLPIIIIIIYELYFVWI